MHIAARTRVLEAERRVFGEGPKRAFDTALQEMLNQATIEVNGVTFCTLYLPILMAKCAVLCLNVYQITHR